MTVKTFLIFEKRFTILKTVNRFPKLYSLSFHARLIFDCRNPATSGYWNNAGVGIRPPEYCRHRNPATSGHCRRMPADQILAESGRNPAMVKSRPDLAKMAGIRLNLIGSGGVLLESGNDDRTLPDSGNNCIFTFRNFFVRTKRRKIFSRKFFFLKMISLKIFYNENYFTSKQTEH